MSRRFENAAERQGGGDEEAEVRGEKARFRARKSRSDVEGDVEKRVSGLVDVEGLDSMSVTTLRDGITAYRRLMKSLRSISKASPDQASR